MELGVKSVLIDVLGDQDLKGGCDRTEIWHFAAPETTEQPKTYGRVDQDPFFQNLAASPLLVLNNCRDKSYNPLCIMHIISKSSKV